MAPLCPYCTIPLVKHYPCQDTKHYPAWKCTSCSPHETFTSEELATIRALLEA